MKKIISIGTEIADAHSEYFELEDKNSLLDYDIIVINPALPFSYLSGSETYNGKECLSDSKSFALKDDLTHLKREIHEALQAGKTIIFLMAPETIVYVATGDVNYSGTGRNARKTRVVDTLSNYSILSAYIKVTNTKGSLMKLAANAQLFKEYWKNFGEHSEYNILIDSTNIEPIVQTKSGNKTVGARVLVPNHTGVLLLLPYIDFAQDEFYSDSEEDENASGFSTLGVQFGERFIQMIIELDKAIHAGATDTPAPNWTESEEYTIGKETELKVKLGEFDREMNKLLDEKSQTEVLLAQEQQLKKLLYETGKPLEHVILKALTILGFVAKNFTDAIYEFDVMFESEEGRLLGEAEGKDNKPINVEKIRQLGMNVQEEFANSSDLNLAKGVLFGNGYRLTKPEERVQEFTDRCIVAAKTASIALVSTADLFRVARYLLASGDIDFARKCRIELVAAVGMFKFPGLPETEGDL